MTNLKIRHALMVQGFYAQVAKFRKLAQREKSRRRKYAAREKLKAAAKSGDAEAIVKVKAYKEANRIRSAEYFKRKKEERGQKGIHCPKFLNNSSNDGKS